VAGGCKKRLKVKPTIAVTSDGMELTLTIGREYEVLGIEADSYRILNNPETWPYGNDPVLFAPQYFEIVDPTIPTFWNCTIGDEGEKYCYPPEWSTVGFFEDYHDGVEVVCSNFWKDLKRYYPETWRERSLK